MLKETFLKNAANWNNHLFLLWPALEATEGDVVELGMGDGSTPQLHEYCFDAGRKLFSFDNNLEWVEKFRHYESAEHRVAWVTDWDVVSVNQPFPSVLLVDHAPGERRWVDIQRYANKAKIIVIHDSEPAATGYMLDKIWALFKYRKDYKTDGAWATVVSNFYDVTQLPH